MNGTMTRAKVPRADQDLYNQALRMGLKSEVDAVRAELVGGEDASPATVKFFAGRSNSQARLRHFCHLCRLLLLSCCALLFLPLPSCWTAEPSRS